MINHVSMTTRKAGACLGIAAYVLALLASLLLIGCDMRPAVEGELQTAARTIIGPSCTSTAQQSNSSAVVDSQDDDSCARLSPATARFVLYGDWQLRNFSGPTPQGQFGPIPSDPSSSGPSAKSASVGTQSAINRLVDTEAYRHLVDRAHATLGGSFAIAHDAVVQFQRLAEAERAEVARQAERALWALAAGLEAAGADDALERVLASEAELKTFAEDLKTASKHLGSMVPSEPMALIPLPPPEILERAIAGLEVRQRRLGELLAISSDPQTELNRRFVSDQLARMKGARDSAERQKFSVARATVFKDIKSADWSALVATRKTRTDALMSRMRERLEITTGYLELRMAANGIRGPPDALADMVMTSLRSYDIDASEWTRNEARLRALASQLSRLADGDAVLEAAKTTELDVIAAMLDDKKLSVLLDMNRGVERSFSRDMPSDYLFTDKRLHHMRWQNALDREAERRKQGRAGIRGSAAAQKLVATYANAAPRGLPTPLAESYFLQLVDYRFPHLDAMPHGLRADAGAVLKSALSESIERATKLVAEYRDISDKLARSTTEVPTELLSSYRRSRSSLEGMAFHLDKAFVQAQGFNANVDDIRPRKDAILALLPGLRDWRPPEPSATEGPKPDGTPGGAGGFLGDRFPPRPPGGADLRLRRYQPGFEKDLRLVAAFVDSARQHLDQALKLAEGIDVGPPKFAAARGRFTVTEKELWAGRVQDGSEPFSGDAMQRRLDFEWNGRLDEKGQPYKFADVKDPKQMKALGGGIHLGETASSEELERLVHLALAYEPRVGLVLRDGPSNRRWIVVSNDDVDATSLKALYRFAKSGRNAALSIGWASGRQTAEKLPERETTPVLPDPYLVDTAAGRDLLLADLLPWKLENPALPNGVRVTFHHQFKGLAAEYRRDLLLELEKLVAQTESYSPNDRVQWAERFKAEQADLSVQALWQFDSMDEARRWHVERLEEKQFEALRTRYGDELRHVFEADVRSDPAASRKWNSLSHRKQQQILDGFVNDRIRESLAQWWAKLPQQIDGARLQALGNAIFETMAYPTAANRAVVECWIAVQKWRKVPDKEIARALLEVSNPTTLAALHDDRVVFTVRGDGKVVFETKLKYLYVTSFVRTTEQHVGTSTSPEDANADVFRLYKLEALVNAHMDELLKAYPPLRRAKRHAEIAAFFRWAIDAQQKGILALIDLGELGAVSANNRAKFPTPDALKRQ
ncbi:hypothetical protein LLG90_00850 [Aromatoleum toluclasticum]|uniref:hypothetical protein n=1 Tax=Aromatoleum toluclasticum TaxID=92003 RepID=UPI001D182D9C|nr:hypothetical protein [Aromatoleum toluclasticum]MCC4113891.1 hypothetical protein [Aromatoleum toluclasticum]